MSLEEIPTETLGQIHKKQSSPRRLNERRAELIKEQIGELEEIRALFGLNKKKMCELLLIDPSSWTRWTTGKATPPPSIYRSLQWGLAVMEKYPETHPLSTHFAKERQATESLEVKSLKEKVLALEKQSQTQWKKERQSPQRNYLQLFLALSLIVNLLFWVSSLKH